MHAITESRGLVTDQDNYGIFYPVDGLLQAGYNDLGHAEQMRDNLLDMFPDAYVVRVRIERV